MVDSVHSMSGARHCFVPPLLIFFWPTIILGARLTTSRQLVIKWPLQRFVCCCCTFCTTNKLKSIHSFIHHHPESLFLVSPALCTMFNKMGCFADDQKSLSSDIVPSTSLPTSCHCWLVYSTTATVPSSP
jgi:hypothetical protein